MKQDKVKQVARDESLAPSNARVKIGNSRVKVGINNLRMDPSAKQKEETYQVARDIFKITPFYNAFLISADVTEIYILKFVNKGDKYQVYGKHIPDTLLTEDIKISNAYQMYYKYSKGLIPPKIGRGKDAMEDKAVATDSSNKKLTKWKLVLKDGTDMSEEELEHRPLSSKKSVPKAVVIQEPLSVYLKRLADVKANYNTTLVAQVKDLVVNQGVLDDQTGKSSVLDEEVGIQSKVPDETKNLKEEDNRSSDTVETANERTKSDEHQGKGDAGMNIEHEVEKEVSEEKPKGDAQATDAQPNEDNKDKFEFIQPISSQSFYLVANQFILNSPNAFLLGIITEPTEGDITSIIDVHIQQDVPTFVPKTLHTVTVSVTPETTQAPPPPPPAAIVTLATQVPNTEAANNAELKKELSELNYKEIIKESVKAHIVTEVQNFMPFLPNAVFNFATPMIENFSQKAVSDFAKPMLQEAIAKSQIFLAQSSLSHQSAIEAAKSLSELELKQILYDKILKSRSSCSHKTHEELFNTLTWSIKLDESRSTHSTKPDQIPKKRNYGDDDQNEDPSVVSNQGKETKKKRNEKENESSNKSSTPKESTKAFAMNRLGLTMLNKEVLVGPIFNLLKGTYKRYGELEYNFEECFRALTDQLDWINPEGYDHPDMCKPLPLIEKEGRFTIHVEVFFNNDIEYLKGDKTERTYFSSITKMPAAKYTTEVHAVEATDDSSAVPEHTTVETPTNMSSENKAHFLAEKEAIHLILTGIGDDIYSTVDTCQTAQEIWEAIEMLQQGESLNIQDVKINLFWEFSKFTSHDGESMESYYTRFYKLMNEMIRNNLTVTTMQQHKLNEVSYHKLFDILKQYQNEVNELRAEKLAKNANPLAFVATAQARQDQYYQRSRSHRSSAPSPKPLIPSRSHTTIKHKGKEIAKTNLALIAKYFNKLYKPTNNNLKTSSNSKNKNVDTTPRYKNDDHSGQFGTQRTVNVAVARENVGSKVVQQSGIQFFNCKEYGHFAKECTKSKRVKDSTYHKEKMLLCKQAEQGIPRQAEQYDWLADTDEEVDEQELEAHYSYMAKIQEVPTADSGTYSEPVEQNEQNDVESDDERVALANLIANLKLDVDENKKIQKQLKKANTTLAQELKDCKAILAKTSKSLGESISVRDSCLIALRPSRLSLRSLRPLMTVPLTMTNLNVS
nr:hypothetical protein [Tanacetum cinerariifolium]